MLALRRMIRVIIRARPLVVPLFNGYGEGRSLISSTVPRQGGSRIWCLHSDLIMLATESFLL